MFALPKALTEKGVLRYGFHGLSYEFVAGALARYDRALAEGGVIVCHLGNGASACAMRGGRSVASSMGFSALVRRADDGHADRRGRSCGRLPPDPRGGDVARRGRELPFKKCGLLGVSGLSNDMRVLREAAATNADARTAIDLFVYRIVREVGSLAAALGGLDGLVFTAGIGENDAATRAEVIAGLGWLGFELDDAANAAGGPRISRGPRALRVGDPHQRRTGDRPPHGGARAHACSLTTRGRGRP